MSILMANPPMHLVDDEIVIMDHDDEDEAFRMRVWRHRDFPAVVLITREPGFISPSKVTARLANVAYKVYLAYDPKGLHFIEWDGTQLQAVSFVGVGRDDRLVLIRPERSPVSLPYLETLVGGPVEL